MALSQIRTFLRSATKKQAVKQMQFVMGVAIGAQGDKKGIEKTMAELQKVIDSAS